MVLYIFKIFCVDCILQYFDKESKKKKKLGIKKYATIKYFSELKTGEKSHFLDLFQNFIGMRKMSINLAFYLP